MRLICEYYFSRKFNDRSVGDEINLKYTPGGYRDILFLDLYSRIVQGEGWRGLMHGPEIEYGLDTVSSALGLSRERAVALRRAVKWVAFVKSAVLDLFSETELRGRAPMSLAVARLLSESRYYSSLMLESSATTEDIIGLHRSANVTIAEVVDGLVMSSHNSVWEYMDGDQRELARTVRGIWLEDAGYVKRGVEYSKECVDYGVLSALICTNAAGPSWLDNVARRVASRPGYMYLNRLLLKNEQTSIATLKYIVKNNQIALDGAVDGRYRELGEDRIRKDKGYQ